MIAAWGNMYVSQLKDSTKPPQMIDGSFEPPEFDAWIPQRKERTNSREVSSDLHTCTMDLHASIMYACDNNKFKINSDTQEKLLHSFNYKKIERYSKVSKRQEKKFLKCVTWLGKTTGRRWQVFILHCASAYCWVLLLEINHLKSPTRYLFFKSRRRASIWRDVCTSVPAVVIVVGALRFKEVFLECQLKWMNALRLLPADDLSNMTSAKWWLPRVTS